EKGISIKKKVEYNEQDICELKENAAQEQPCRSPDNISLNTRGIASEKANERQPYEYSKKEYEYVLQFRAQGEIHLKNANALKDTIHSRNQTLEQLKELANRK
ncbi:hypothetical protein, partial [Yersinia pseudotuberculosis]